MRYLVSTTTAPGRSRAFLLRATFRALPLVVKCDFELVVCRTSQPSLGRDSPPGSLELHHGDVCIFHATTSTAERTSGTTDGSDKDSTQYVTKGEMEKVALNLQALCSCAAWQPVACLSSTTRKPVWETAGHVQAKEVRLAREHCTATGVRRLSSCGLQRRN